MIYTELTKKALIKSFDTHKDQTDKSGIPYIFHPFHIAEQMDDEYATCAALLYYIIKDTDITLNDLKSEGYPSEAINVLTLLTHNDEVSYLDYIRKIKTNPIAKKVKLAYLEHIIELFSLEAAENTVVESIDNYKRAVFILKRKESPQKIIDAWETRCCHAIVPKFWNNCPLCKKVINDPMETNMRVNTNAKYVEDYPIKVRLPEREPGSIVRRTDFNYLNGHGTFYRFDEDHFPLDLLNAKREDHVSVVLYNIHTDQLDEVVFSQINKSPFGDHCVWIHGFIDDIKECFEIRIQYYYDDPLESKILVFASAPPFYG